MANEPSWEDIFNPRPTEPAQQQAEAPIEVPPMQATPYTPPPLVEPAATPPVYPPTQAYPTAEPSIAPEYQAYPEAVAPAVAAAPAPEAVREAAPSDDPFFALFGESAPVAAPVAAATTAASPMTSAPVEGAPLSRREMRESEGRPRQSDSGGGRGGSGSGGRGDGSGGGKPKKKRNLLWLKITLPIVLVLGAAGGAAAFAWLNYEEQVREVMGWQLPTDYETAGNGEEVIVTIQSGDIGSDVANTLHDAGVTMTFDAFYDLLLSLPEDPGFVPGNYALEKEMSAQSALDALLDPENKVTDRLLITEGTTLPSALEIIAETTGMDLAELQEASIDLASFGLPAEAPSLEGYLFPATYQLDGGQTPHDILQLLVDTMFERLDAAGVAVEDRHRVLTMAALIQREAGPNADDFYKISRVFTNRLEQGINLESDATVAYGADTLHTVWTSDEDRANAANLYNTYANPGLPIGPIGAPGDLAIDAALHPADGPWLFFVPINLATGETVFSETVDEHEAAVEVLREWCRASEENASYCE